jgi:glycosyltransferase involved in cell wall biosynthesis
VQARFPSLTIVMVAYDEAECIRASARDAIAFLEDRVADPELVLVDDGSADGTGLLIDEIAAETPWVRACHHERNRGAGAALKTGFAVASKDWVTIMPADGQIDPRDIEGFFDAARSADLVVSRYRDRDRQYDLYRKVLSTGLRLATALIVGSFVRSESIYVIRRDLLSRLSPRSDSFFLNLELPIRAARQGASVRTVTIGYHPRAAGHSKATSARKILHLLGEVFEARMSFWKEGRDESRTH